MAPKMTQEMGVAEAKRRFSELIERVRRGERFVVTKRGKPVMALVPPAAAELPPTGRKPAGLLSIVGILGDWDELKDWDHDEFVRDIYEARRKSRDRPAPDLRSD